MWTKLLQIIQPSSHASNLSLQPSFAFMFDCAPWVPLVSLCVLWIVNKDPLVCPSWPRWQEKRTPALAVLLLWCQSDLKYQLPKQQLTKTWIFDTRLGRLRSFRQGRYQSSSPSPEDTRSFRDVCGPLQPETVRFGNTSIKEQRTSRASWRRCQRRHKMHSSVH